uniref:NAD(P)-binding domain-containing protein n=1 Tax=Scophthalmus maximus TaxID=52904 RepID=A0A8D3AKL2_SCOMX
WDMGSYICCIPLSSSSGSHLVCSLVDRHPDWRIINLDNVSLHYVCNSQLVDHIFTTETVDVIFHLAAKTHVEASFESQSTFQLVNVDGTRVLLAAARRARHRPQRFVYVSTDEVYGASVDEVFDESSPPRPTNPYSATKAAAEQLVKSYWDKYKVNTHTQTPPLAVSFFVRSLPRRYSIPQLLFLTLLQMNKRCTIQGTLPKSRHFLFVDDAVAAFLLVLEKGTVGEIYNVGTTCEVPIMQLARQLIRMIKNVPDSEVKDWLEFVPDRPRVDLRYPITCEKLQQLGWRAEVSWAEGIRHTVKWYQENPDFWSDKSELQQ